MAKKNKSTISSDSVRGRQKGKNVKINPFEVKVNRQKHDVLGRKVSKHDRGQPGLSRSKANNKRKETLLKEYKNRFKSNTFVDKRIGEGDMNLSLEDKMVKRFAAEKQKSERGSLYNLAEEEELTHYGQSLADIEKFEEPSISDEEDDEEKYQNAKIVAEEHFGGFLKKTDDDTAERKTWKEKMEDLISKSKKEKYERQAEKEKAVELTEQLDEEWKDLRSLMGKIGHRTDDEKTVTKNTDDYDIAVRELKFEIKGKATDRLKTDEELAKDEKERLDKLEADRMRRMKGITEEDENIQKSSHKSAEDLNDGFALDKSVRFHLAYKDGKILEEEPEEMEGVDDKDADSGGSDEDQTNGDESDEAEVQEADGSGDDDNEADDSGDDDDADEESDDSFADIGSEPEDADSDAQMESDQKKTLSEKRKKSSLDKKKMIEKAKAEIPYTFKAPDNYDELLMLLHGHTNEEQTLIIERIRKCHHVSLSEGNKQKLQTLFCLTLQYFTDLGIQEPPELNLMDKLTPHLYALTQQFPGPATLAILDQISDRQAEFKQICDRKAGRGLYPGLDTLLLLKLVSVLYPTSDFWHAVVTPCFIFISQMLAQCPVYHERDISAGLFLSNLCLEFVSFSKRYVPEAINLLNGLLFLGSEKQQNKIESVIPPFKPVGKNIDLLKIDSSHKSRKLTVNPLKLNEVLSTEIHFGDLSNNQFRVDALSCTLSVLSQFVCLYADLSSFKEIFAPTLKYCERLPKHLYPSSLQTQVEDLVTAIEKCGMKPRKHLVMNKRKPKSIKLYEPKVEEVFEGRKKKTGDKAMNEKQKLISKHKKEMKGAIREIRKDTQFLAREKLTEQLNRDAERKRKVKELYASLANQEGECRALKRKREQTTD